MLRKFLPGYCRRKRIFLSYAHEDFPIAEKVAQTLRAAGHTVFFDTQSLVGSDDFNARIRDAINASELFVFLVSRAALDAGSFTLTELRFARERWPGGAGTVLPVIIDKDLDLKDLPVYLASVHIFQPEGNIPAETANEVEKSGSINGVCQTCLGLGCALLAGLLGFLSYAFVVPLLRPTEVTVAPLQFAHFRPARRPPPDSKTNLAWLDAPAMLMLPVSYTHRTQPGKNAQILEERVELRIGETKIPYTWLYKVDIRDGCNSGDQWLCSLGPALPETLAPGQTISRETMYQPGIKFSYGDLIAAIRSEKTDKISLKLISDIDLGKQAKTPRVTREQICEMRVKDAQAYFEKYFSERGENSVWWFKRDCVGKP